MRSEHELRSGLQRRGAEPKIIEDCLAALRRVGLVDDAAFASAWIESRMRVHPLGRRALTRELLLKGIKQEFAKASVEEAVTPQVEMSAALDVARRYLRSGTNPAALSRAQAALARRGFDWGIIGQVMESLSADAAET